MEHLLNELNSQQRQAVEYTSGPSLIIAGAGSGKTRVLTFKIAYLLKQGMDPQNILALTFTNKAAKEMKERIASLIGWQYARGLWMGTFHSVFSRILRNEAECIGFTSNFSIMDSADSKNLIKTIIKEYQLDDKTYKPSKIQSIISNAKNSLISPQMYAQNKELIEYDTKAKIPFVKNIYQEYNLRLKRSNAMDFDDLLFFTNRLFRDNTEVLRKYQEHLKFILVDEYQDTNFAQYLVIKQLSELHHMVCVVGDDAQSIYSFRGANISNILKFQETYPESKLFKLEQNYRSTQNIVNAANSLIKQNKEQIKKTVFSEKQTGDKIEVVGAYSDFEEGVVVANKIMELKQLHLQPYNHFAILYRTNAQSRIFEESLRKKNIPYRIYGGLSFYQRKEIKDVIAYFRMIVNPDDEEAFKRIINYPTRGIGTTTVNKIISASRHYNVSLWQTIAAVLDYDLSLNAGTTKKLLAFKEMLDSFIALSKETNAYELASTVVKESGIGSDAYKDKTPEGMSRQENIQELLSGIHEFCESRIEEGNENIKLINFLAEVSLLTDQDRDKDEESQKVTLMTIHASKGLEFKNVFIVGLEEDLFPSMMVKNEPKGLEEERRLFYVALTRAENFCMLSYAKSRFRNGSSNFCNPSRFIGDIDPKFLKGSTLEIKSNRENTTYRKEENIKSYQTGSPASPSTQRPNPLKPINQVLSNSKSASNNPLITDLKAGDTILHDRFGIGHVVSIEGERENAKAIVNFENTGSKTLLLKFAKFKVID